MRYKELRLKFVEATGQIPAFSFSFNIDASYNIPGGHTFYFVAQRSQANEITIGNTPEETNQNIKAAFDADLMPYGVFETDIDNDYVYLYSNVAASSFEYFNQIGSTVYNEINNALEPVLNILEAPGENILLNAYNNNVVIIEQGDSTKLELTFNSELATTLYPSPNGEYYLNLKDAATALINKNRFADEILPDIQNESYCYTDNSMLLELEVKITGITDRGNFEQKLKYWFLKSVEQIPNFKNSIFNLLNDKAKFLLPQNKVTYYEGYPFDVSLISLNTSFQDVTGPPPIEIKNRTNGLSTTIQVETFKEVTRIFFSQGSENFTIEDVLPLQTGINRLEFVVFESKSILLEVNKKESVCAPYFKFYRNKGGWGYIRFKKEFEQESKVRDGDNINIDFNSIADTLTTSLNLGNEVNREYTFETEKLTNWELQNFKDFVRSPRVEMYVQDLFQKQKKDSWVGVQVKSSSLTERNLKTKLNTERVKVEFNEYSLHL